MSYIAKNGRLYTSGASEALTLLDDKFSVNKSYSKGDSCIYNDYLWKFTSDKPAGEWDNSVVEQCRIMDFVDGINGHLTQSIDSIQNQIVPTASIEMGETASKAYNVGDFLVKDSILYKVTKAIVKDDILTVGANIVMTTVGSELSEKSNSFPIKEVLHVASTTATATDYTTEPLDDYNFFIVSCGVLGFRPTVLYKGSPTAFFSKAELLDTSNYTYGTQLKTYDTDGTPGSRITNIKYVNNTTIKLWYQSPYPSEVRIYGIKC